MPEEPKITFPAQTVGEKAQPLFKLPIDYSDLLKKFEFQTNIVIGVFIIALATMIFMAATLMVDAWHFNSAVYKEYSEKIDTLDQLQATNKYLQIQIQQDQQVVSDRQEKILRVLGDISTQKK